MVLGVVANSFEVAGAYSSPLQLPLYFVHSYSSGETETPRPGEDDEPRFTDPKSDKKDSTSVSRRV